MGWTESHLHQFEKDRKDWGVPARDEFGDLDLIDGSKTTLAEALEGGRGLHDAVNPKGETRS